MSDDCKSTEWFHHYIDGQCEYCGVIENPIDDTHDYVNELEATTTRLRGLLRRCKFLIDASGEDNKEFMRQFDSTLFDELAEELKDD